MRCACSELQARGHTMLVWGWANVVDDATTLNLEGLEYLYVETKKPKGFLNWKSS